MHPALHTRLFPSLMLTQHLNGESHCVIGSVTGVFSRVLNLGSRDEQPAMGTLLLQDQAAPSLEPDPLLCPAHRCIRTGQLTAQCHRLPRGHRHDRDRSAGLQDPHWRLCRYGMSVTQSSAETTQPWALLCCQPQVSTCAGWPSAWAPTGGQNHISTSTDLTP